MNVEQMSEVDRIIAAGPGALRDDSFSDDDKQAAVEEVTRRVIDQHVEILGSLNEAPFMWDVPGRPWICLFDRKDFMFCIQTDLAQWRKLWREQGFGEAWRRSRKHYDEAGVSFDVSEEDGVLIAIGFRGERLRLHREGKL